LNERGYQIQVDLKPISPNIDSFLSLKRLNIKYTTEKKYYYNLRKFFRFTDSDIVTETNLKEYLDSVKVSSGQYNNILITIKQYAKYLANKKIIPDCSFLDSFKLKKVSIAREKKFYSEKEINNLLKGILSKGLPRWLYWFIWFGFQFGIRPKEIALLELRDFDKKDWIIHLRADITKTNTESWIVIPKPLHLKMRELFIWRSLQETDSARLFVNKWGTPITENSLSNNLKSIRKIDPEFTYYHMRYTTGWRAYSKTGDIYFTAQLLRHKNINQTRDYLQIQKQEILRNLKEKMELVYR